MPKLSRVKVSDRLQPGYEYERTEPMGKNFDSEFKPDLTPKEMLELGVFGGHYFGNSTDLTATKEEFPKEWFTRAKINTDTLDKNCNYFGVNASQPLSVWQAKGWIYPEDPLGWFQWYCRYYVGRRIPQEDARQIRRWKAMSRHIMQIRNSCRPGDATCHTRQRQAVLHWSYDSRKM
jgi:hypothetical protein